MPGPILHSFAGYGIYCLSERNQKGRNWKIALLCIVLANLPDFDFLPGLFQGRAALFHRGFTHSFGASLLCGLIVGASVWIWKRRSFVRSFLLSASVYFSHTALDFFNGLEFGMPVFWPFSAQSFHGPFSLYGPLEHFLGGGNSVLRLRGFHDFALWFWSAEFFRLMFLELTLVFLAWTVLTVVSERKRNVRAVESMAIVRALQAVIFFVGLLVAGV